jgi:hypothetical protein
LLREVPRVEPGRSHRSCRDDAVRAFAAGSGTDAVGRQVENISHRNHRFPSRSEVEYLRGYRFPAVGHTSLVDTSRGASVPA